MPVGIDPEETVILAGRGHVPLRMCAGCGRRLAQGSLVRFVSVVPTAPESEESGGERQVTLDHQGKGPGRGAYVCPRIQCFEAAEKRKSLQRRLRAARLEPDLRQKFICLIEGREN